MTDTTDKAKLVKLLAAFRETHDRQAMIFDEIDAILGGRASIGELMKEGRGAFMRAWGARYGGGAYAWQMTRDMPNLKRLVKMLGVPEFEARCGRYIQNSDPYVTKARHSFALFVATINQYAVEAPTGELVLDGDDTLPIGCKHQPPCLTDVMHTSRLRAEIRS